MESITAYKNQRGQPRSGTAEQSDTPVSANDMCSLAEWPSHARRNCALLQDEAGGQKKKGRGVLKGFKASKKRFANGSSKLNITFSEKLGGTVGMNYRSFKDDVDRWDLEDTPETEEKVLKIVKERYRGWRSTLSSTYKAYKIDAARLANLPEDLQPEEWEWMIEYLALIQNFSQKNTDNRKKQKRKHIIGSKSYSQVSFEKRNLETGEEPDCIALWELTHTNDGTWSNTDSQKVYDKALQEVKNKETVTKGPLSSEQKNNIFQTACKDTLECKSSQPRGYGYMAKTSTGSERFRIQIEEQARATAATQEQNSQLSQQVPTKRVDKENSNPNLQNIPLQRSSPNKTLGSRPTAISSNALIQAAARQSRMFKAMKLLVDVRSDDGTILYARAGCHEHARDAFADESTTMSHAVSIGANMGVEPKN
uniref:Uncharacterized protein n=1 Tax=Aegilops tauschii TaxID=37682 RepID=R7W3Z0_AEGTA